MMNLQPILEDGLILLRPIRESDFDSLYQIAKDPLIWEQHPCYDRYKKDVYTNFFEDALKSGGALIIIDKLNQNIIGSSRYKLVENVENAVEIGWSFLSRKYWGGKYNGSVKRLMIDYAFKSVEDIVFYIGEENIRSQKAVQKIGGLRIIDAKYQYLLSKIPGDWTYRINKSKWKN